MKDCIFSLGKIDKRIIWPFLFALIQCALYLIDSLFPRDKVNQIIDNFAVSLSQLLIIIIPFIFKTKEKIIKKDEICTKKNIKYQAILWIINLVLFFFIRLASLKGSTITSLHNSLLATREAIEIIILIIITMIFFKSKYYIHHIISLVIYCSLSVGIDFLLDNYNVELLVQTPLQIISNIGTLILEIVLICYQAYMMNILYYHYWTICFSLGLFLLLISLFTLILAYTLGDENNEENFFYSYFQFLKNAEYKYSIPRFLSWIVIYAFMDIFKLLTLEKLTPNHMMISYGISKFANNLIWSQNRRKWYSIILFLLQFIILFFFLELLEFNFCNLNKNTKRNIEKRGLISMDMRESINSNNEIFIEEYSFQPENPGKIQEMEIINNDKEDENSLN